jgi:hypothetical protein
LGNRSLSDIDQKIPISPADAERSELLLTDFVMSWSRSYTPYERHRKALYCQTEDYSNPSGVRAPDR